MRLTEEERRRADEERRGREEERRMREEEKRRREEEQWRREESEKRAEEKKREMEEEEKRKMEEAEKGKKELQDRINRLQEQISDYNRMLVKNSITSLDRTSVIFPYTDYIKREGNVILHTGGEAWRHCFVGGVITSVCSLLLLSYRYTPSPSSHSPFSSLLLFRVFITCLSASYNPSLVHPSLLFPSLLFLSANSLFFRKANIVFLSLFHLCIYAPLPFSPHFFISSQPMFQFSAYSIPHKAILRISQPFQAIIKVSLPSPLLLSTTSTTSSSSSSSSFSSSSSSSSFSFSSSLYIFLFSLFIRCTNECWFVSSSNLYPIHLFPFFSYFFFFFFTSLSSLHPRWKIA